MTKVEGKGRAIWCTVRYWAALLAPLAFAALAGGRRRGLDDRFKEAGTVEVGVTGSDLRFWRAKEAVRIAEAKLSSQVQASQALESRAISLIGWSVAGLLALGAAVAGGTHVVAAGIPAVCLFIASILSAWSIMRRRFYTGYDPITVLEDRSGSEYELTESFAKGYQRSVEENTRRLDRSKQLLAAAIVLLVAAPFTGLTAFVLLPGEPVPPDWRVTPIRGASAWRVCHGAAGFRECVPCLSPLSDNVRIKHIWSARARIASPGLAIVEPPRAAAGHVLPPCLKG